LYRKGLAIKIRNVLAPKYAHLLTIKILHPDSKVASGQIVPRSLRWWLRLKSCTGIRFWSPKTLYRDSTVCRRKLVPGYAKTTPCFAHYSSGGIIFIARIHVTASIRLSNVY
jgi:hypothetical protein